MDIIKIDNDRTVIQIYLSDLTPENQDKYRSNFDVEILDRTIYTEFIDNSKDSLLRTSEIAEDRGYNNCRYFRIEFDNNYTDMYVAIPDIDNHKKLEYNDIFKIVSKEIDTDLIDLIEDIVEIDKEEYIDYLKNYIKDTNMVKDNDERRGD